MTPLGKTPHIAAINFEDGFTGNGKIFVKVETTKNNSQKLVIYERSGLIAFFSDIFRNRKNTFTLREWASHEVGGLPQSFNKERLTQNIKQVQQTSRTVALNVLNSLVASKDLDADSKSVSDQINKNLVDIASTPIDEDLTPLPLTKFIRCAENSLKLILANLGLSENQISLLIQGKNAQLNADVMATGKLRISSFNDSDLQLAYDQLIQPMLSTFIPTIKFVAISDTLSPDGNQKALKATPSSEIKSLAKFLLILDHKNADGDEEHQRYRNTLKQVIKKLESIEKAEAKANSLT